MVEDQAWQIKNMPVCELITKVAALIQRFLELYRSIDLDKISKRRLIEDALVSVD